MAIKFNISVHIFWSTLFVVLFSGLLFSQTAPNTPIINQAKAVYTFKTFPADTIRSNTTQFTVLDAPNFELSFGSTNSFVFAKETVIVRLVYKNIGNKKADTASIEGVLPPAGLRFVPGSTLGVITGNTVSWKVFNVEPNRTDSVAVKAVVDSTVIVLTELQLNSSLTWSSSSVNSNHTLTVSSFPRLVLSITPSSAVVGSGRTISYLIAVKNSGNIPSNNTVLYDTISNLGTFVNSTIVPDSISADKRLLKWNIGTIPAFGERIISLTVLTVPNLGQQNITNSAFTFSSNGTVNDKKKVSNSIVPIVPKTISFAPEPLFIFGKMNADSSKIDITVKDSINMVLPDGVNVQLAVSFGTFSNNTASFSTVIQNGKATAFIRSADVSNEIVRVKITGTAGSVASGTIQDTTNIFMYPGAVTGVVVDGVNRTPFAGAIALVYNQNNGIVGADTTKSNGRFFIPLNKDVAKYKLKIFVIDRFGDSISTTIDIDPRLFPLPPISMPNIIAGRILYRISNQPVAAEGVTVFLDSVSQNLSRSLRGSGNIKKIAAQNSLARVSEQETDNDGKFKFENLKPARYLISVDSSQFPSFQGYSFLTDTVSGTFTINLAIEIQLDSSLTINSTVKPLSNAKDTLVYKVVINNSGNTEHHSITVTDTLPAYTSFLEAQKGNFDSVNVDGTKGIITWIRDTLKTTEIDTLTFSLLLSDNMPDDTKIRNNVWFQSQSFKTNSLALTTVRSQALFDFRNTFSVLKDSIVAGDSIRNVLWFKNTGTDSLRNVRIVDTIYSAGKTKLSQAIAADSTNIVDSVLTIYINSIPPGKEDSVILKLVTDFTLKTGYKIISSAHLMKGDSSLINKKDSLVMIENSNVSTFLTVLKTANKKVAEIGDVVTYQVQISNSSPQFVSTIGVYDIMPYAFHYVKNSARFNGKAVEPTFSSTLNQMVWRLSDTIQSAKSGNLVYQLAVSADALESEGLNTVYASAVLNLGTQLVSSPSYWQIDVRPGVFTNKGLIIGKVFYDDNRNTFQDEGENGVKDIELWLEDGTKIITGDDGKFSLPEVKPGQHVMRVNERTLPKNSELLIGDNAFAKDPTSRFIRVTEGGIAKANFFLKRTIEDSLWQSLSKVSRLISARQTKPKYVYVDTARSIKIDTVEMFVTFSYSGAKSAQSITIFDVVSDKFTFVPNSASYNGRRINPVIIGKNIQWSLGRAKDVSEGVLRYKVRLNTIPKKGTVLQSYSTIKILSSDSSIVESKNVFVENIVLDTNKNKIETSDIAVNTVSPIGQQKMSDSVLIAAGDEVFFKHTLFLNPKKKFRSVKLLDSLESAFIINERSFMVNNIPLPSNIVSVKVRSSSFSMASTMMRDEMEFVRIASIDLTDFLKNRLNEITYSATLQSTAKDTFYRKTSSAVIKNEFNEENRLRANDIKIFVKKGTKNNSLALETTYVDIPYSSSTSVEGKIAAAVKLVESLRQNNAKAVVMEGITFELGKATLTRESMNILDNISQLLIENIDIKIQVNGYTDNTGNASSNRKMSLYRAKEVTTYLIAKGIDPKRLIAQGFGSNNPIVSNKTEEGRAKNRRVEFARMK